MTFGPYDNYDDVPPALPRKAKMRSLNWSNLFLAIWLEAAYQFHGKPVSTRRQWLRNRA